MPARGRRADYVGNLEVHRYRTLQEFVAASGQDRHSVRVDFGVFRKASIPDKSDPQRLYNPEELDFRLVPGSAASGAAIPLPTITDGFAGPAPDLGAYPSGVAPPTYGPRSQPVGQPGPEAPRSIRGPGG